MAHVRLGTGRFLKVDGIVIQDLEDLIAGVITEIPALNGTGGCRLEIGAFLER